MMNTTIDSFENWTSFLEFLENRKMKMIGSSVSSESYRSSWTGTKDYPSALQLARQGWSEGVEQVRTYSGEIESRLYATIERQDIVYDVTGELLDVGRFVTGEPEHWGNWVPTLHEGTGTKHIHLVVNNTVSGGVNTDVIITRGAAIAALTNLLELAGHRVKVTMVCSNCLSNYYYEFRVNVKQFDEALDLDRVTYAVAHPSVFRRHFFHAEEGLPADYRKALNIGSGYGRVVDTDGDRGDIYMGMQHYDSDHWQSAEKATQWVNQELIRLGVIAKPLEGK